MEKVAAADASLQNNNKKAQVLSETLDNATEKFLENDKSPSRKVNERDTRGSHFYLCLYWAEELANQNDDSELKEIFSKISEQLSSKESTIEKELIDAQGTTMDIGGYYLSEREMASKAMRPSSTLNTILESLG